MLQRHRELLQSQIIANIQRAHPGTTQSDIGAATGADRSLVSKWASGDREMTLAHLHAAAKAYGAATVYGPLTADVGADVGADVVPQEAAETACVRGMALDVNMGAAELTRLLHDALADGRLSAHERRTVNAKVRELVDMLHGVGAAARRAS